MTSRLEDALERCLQAMRQGDSLEAALKLAPGLADELRPLLEAAQAAASVSLDGVPRHAIVRSRTRMLQRARSMTGEPSRRFSVFAMLTRPALAIVIVGLTLAGGLGAVGAAAAQSLPGDVLYPAKLVAEDVLLQLTTNPASRLRLEAAYGEQRAEEVRRVLQLKRIASVSFTGTVGQRLADGYLVSGIRVHTDGDTRTIGVIVVGSQIEVEGLTRADGSVLAHELHLQAYDMYGVIESIAAETWVVAGLPLAVTQDSVIERGLQTGDQVLVRVRVDDTGGLSIERIRRITPPTPTPMPTLPPPQATSTPIPVPTATLMPDPEPTDDEDGGQEASETPDETDEPGGDEEAEEERELSGVVQAIGSSQWTVDGEVFWIDGNTEIRDNPQVGDEVKVKLERRSDGNWWATRIEEDD
jgi:hypothetical protein